MEGTGDRPGSNNSKTSAPSFSMLSTEMEQKSRSVGEYRTERAVPSHGEHRLHAEAICKTGIPLYVGQYHQSLDFSLGTKHP